MNTLKIALILLLLPLQATADAIPLGDINVTLEVTAQPRIEVETPKSINLVNSPEHGSYSYSAEVPITVKLRRQESYRVSVKQPLILARHSGAIYSPAKEFSPADISWGINHANLRPLSQTPETFTVAKGSSSQTTTDYLLQISAQAPSGQDIAGKYHGQLTLLFETNS
ncbi:TPA: fimbrial protein [Yersinia enterocolitica]|uniref:fimbrial protein n=1 Tax=Yersinia enterocolitica TaxID=630 RepID=UPI001CA4DF67|nr:fimbrial protein [Yersinia enterocolitica]MBW5834358.1 fimbrial protein [Yersinia enterocolitica]MBX9474718.1 fimbrial protein [Yersinia enterocolitica]MBX9488639.1 fimbrial protein [Yersinia enterocolitica]MBX9493815.1 fimbrial protein [Yersinia enterocolitica]HDM8438257.1 fimbrial protein [Yersinia enterocolitica]